MSDLDGARAKVERARKHIGDLSVEKAAFLDTRPYAATPEFYIEHNLTIFYLDLFTKLPDPILAIIGDAVHNLRSALDFLAGALYRRVNAGPGKHIYFPICETLQKYKAESGRKVKGIEQTDIDAIGLLKPYGGGNDSLWGLHHMDLDDKHRLLATAVIGVGRVGFNVDGAFVNRESRGIVRFGSGVFPPQQIWFDIGRMPKRILAFKEGDPIATIAGDREANKDVELAFDVALGEPEVFKGRPILETLHQLADLVAGIVFSFERP